jgi:hypothetical protein
VQQLLANRALESQTHCAGPAPSALFGNLRLWPVAATPQMLCSKLTANMSHKQWRDWVSSDIGYITMRPGLPIPDGGATGQT